MVQKLTVPFIDYSKHPGYSQFYKPSPEGDSKFYNDRFQALDTVFDDLSNSSRYYNNRDCEEIFVQRVDPEIRQLQEKTAELAGDSLFKDAACTAFIGLRNELLHHAQFNNRKKTYRAPDSVSERAKTIAHDITTEGISFYTFDKQAIHEIFGLTDQYRNELLQRVQQNSKKQQGMPLPKTGAFWPKVERMLNDAGFMEGISHYNRCQMDMEHCALYYSHPDETWYREPYSDVGVDTPHTATMHYDHDFSSTKILFYLDDVTENDGPFSLIKGSHIWPKCFSQFAYYKQLDQTIAKAATQHGHPVTDYYRVCIAYPEFRSEFMKLPVPLQGASHFGDDVVNGTELSDFLLSKEVKVTSDKGNCAVFVGHSAIHRGGMVGAGGHRWAFQIIFTPRDPSFNATLRRFKSSLKRIIS